MKEKKAKRGINTQRWKRWIFLIVAILGSLIILAYLFVYLMFSGTGSRELLSARMFLTAILNDKEFVATQYLSSELKGNVEQSCPNSSLAGCFEDLIPESWGQLEDIKFGIGSGDHTNLYYSFWSNITQSVVIVVMMTEEEDGIWLVNGWRGFVPSEGENRDAELWKGTRTDNQFP